MNTTTGESQVFRCSSDDDNRDNLQPEHTTTSQCVNHVRPDQLDDSVLEHIIVFRRDEETLAVEIEILELVKVFNFRIVIIAVGSNPGLVGGES